MAYNSKSVKCVGFFILIYLLIDSSQATSHQWEPQIAVLCESGHSYHPQRLSDDGKWITNLNLKVSGSCLKDKIELLNYCKSAYPGRDITNIVESSHYQKIGGWCHTNTSNINKCKGTARWIKPFRCLEGPFQSDALLVPEGCLFDHIHNTSRCWPFMKWNQTGALACKERNMQIRSFAMLLPCGISLFSGVEFVCCPKILKASERVKKTDLPIIFEEKESDSELLSEEDDVDDQENNSDMDSDTNDYDDDYSDEKTDSEMSLATKLMSSTVSTDMSMHSIQSTSKGFVDPYFTVFNPKLEHQNFKDAQQRLEETHREKVTKVMKDWSDLEEKYQDMRSSNPIDAQNFKQKMTQRFQLSVQTLEDEENAAKHQLAAMHQQRVLERINQRKRDAMKCYTEALTKLNPDTQTVEKCLQKLLRALHKDRSHALAHYRHILSSQKNGIEAAAPERALTLSRLVDIDKAVNQSMAMLKRFPVLSHKLTQVMTDYVQALRSKDETPGLALAPSQDAEESILDKYKSEVLQNLAEKERLHLADKKKLQLRNKEHKKLAKQRLTESNPATTEASYQTTTAIEQTRKPEEIEYPTSTVSPNNDLAVKKIVEDVATVLTYEVPEPKVQHVMGSNFGHRESEFKTKESKKGTNVYLITGISALIVGTLLLIVKLRQPCTPRGFVEVDQRKNLSATSEEKHVTNMQVNGYENPTYKYFEIKE